MARFTIEQSARPAIYTPRFDNPNLGLKKQVPVKCLVLGGPWPVGALNDDGIDVYFIIEFEEGMCAYASPDSIRFVDKRFDEYSFGGAER